MREIKFQIYWVTGREMLYDTNNDFEFRDKENYWIVDLSDARHHPWLYKVRQYTGLKDRNGVEIYDGDIVKYFKSELATIVYRDGGVDIRSLSWKECKPLQRRLGEIEVLGNIYENPELLEESHANETSNR